jgi:hypothetical protein
MDESFLSEVRVRIFVLSYRNCSFDGPVLVIIPQPYFIFLLFKTLMIYHLSEPFQCRLPVYRILAQFTKDWWHCIAASPYTIPCWTWLHHNISINPQVHLSLEQECRYPIFLECIFDNLAATTCFHWSLLEVYTFESWIVLVWPWSRLDLIRITL